ncbi:MAG: FHA domain-containing protein, partial [Deferribacteraceae bacterium]|nr:FHA domain-containing protein [Deferribacteraceae bacterium]
MPAKVIFTVQKGGLSGKSFTYNKKDSIILGRQDDCSIVLPESTVSRYHCLIDITPPSVAVRDFGSLNGTYLNGAKIGQRAAEVSVEEGREKKGDIFPLHSGDILGLGKECEIRVETALPQYCADCFCEIDNPDF